MQKATPVVSAIMCDGMGWFTELDYKRMLLLYDEIYYLLPRTPVEFRDVNGRKQFMFFPLAHSSSPLFKVHHYEPGDAFRQAILSAAGCDTASSDFQKVVNRIPEHEQLYTWRVVNADGDIADQQSLGLTPDQTMLAHAVLLNKFLLAADALNSIPITGKPYIHGLISAKYRAGIADLGSTHPDLLPPALVEKRLRFDVVAGRLISALIPDEELEQRTELEILEYKDRNRRLFEQFSYSLRRMVSSVNALPLSREFDAEVDDLLQTEVWREQQEVEQALRSAWGEFFRSSLKTAVGGLLTVGIVPFLSLGAVTAATALAAVTAAAPWAASELIDYLHRRKQAQEHGLYYVLKFAG